jgi:hypothetical protein
MIQRAPKAVELRRLITTVQQRRRQLFERRESQAQHEPPPLVKDETIRSWPEVIIRAADRLRLSDIPIWHVERGSPNFVPERGLSISAFPPIVGFEDA